jgi:hypothetical protein
MQEIPGALQSAGDFFIIYVILVLSGKATR